MWFSVASVVFQRYPLKFHTQVFLKRPSGAQSPVTNSPSPTQGPAPLTCGVSCECLGTRSYETTSRDQRGKIHIFCFTHTPHLTAIPFQFRVWRPVTECLLQIWGFQTVLATLFCSKRPVFVWLVGSWIRISMNACREFSFHVQIVFTIFLYNTVVLESQLLVH